ncbi:MAG: DUF3341 domain-containing protein [Phaeodactylibacter sp.]|uniref:DUF3341 domain-containing protein n=1 Tax=Phaeodactylibacter sp. TaxID=1940289 RepID=UPI0032EBF9A4
MSKQNKDILYGLYNDEEYLLKAVDHANAEGLEITEVFTPFPVHGLDPKLGLAESRLHIAGFVYGLLGTLTAFLFMTWVFTRDWPIIFGGKPYFSAPAFIPITFELTVLFAAVGMVVTFYIICGLGPGVTIPTLDDRITDDKFCIAFDVTGAEATLTDQLKGFFSQTGAAEVNTKNI